MITRYYMRADLAAVLYTRSNRDTRFTCRQCSRGLRRRCQSTTHRPLKSRCGSIQLPGRRCSHSTAVMPATCSGSMHQRGCLSLTQHTSDFQDPQMCTRYVPLFPGGDAAGQSQVRSKSDRAGSAEPARAWRVRREQSRPSSAPSRSIGRPRRLHTRFGKPNRICLGG